MKLDAVTVLTVMGMATERLGLGATYSTSYYEPFHVARVFATLDLMTNGRAAWNVVTSLNDGEAQNMGRDEVVGHDLRYDRADEFMEIVLGHWDAWEDDAIVQDKATGVFAHAEDDLRIMAVIRILEADLGVGGRGRQTVDAHPRDRGQQDAEEAALEVLRHGNPSFRPRIYRSRSIRARDRLEAIPSSPPECAGSDRCPATASL